MPLTAAQKTTLKADIAANTNTVSYGGASVQIKDLPNNGDANFEIAKWYSSTATPDYIVWKSSVSLGDVGKNFNGTELAGLTTGNQTRLQTLAMYFQDGVNPSVADVRGFFSDVWSGAGGATTRANLDALWRRLANRIEKLLASGSGTTQSPSTLTYEGTVSYQDIEEARAS